MPSFLRDPNLFLYLSLRKFCLSHKRDNRFPESNDAITRDTFLLLLLLLQATTFTFLSRAISQVYFLKMLTFRALIIRRRTANKSIPCRENSSRSTKSIPRKSQRAREGLPQAVTHPGAPRVLRGA